MEYVSLWWRGQRNRSNCAMSPTYHSLTVNNSQNHFLVLTPPPPSASNERLLSAGPTCVLCWLPRPASHAVRRTHASSDCFAHNPYPFINHTHSLRPYNAFSQTIFSKQRNCTQ